MSLPNIGPLLLRALVAQDMYLAGGILLIYSLPDGRRHAALRHPAGVDRPAHPAWMPLTDVPPAPITADPAPALTAARPRTAIAVAPTGS